MLATGIDIAENNRAVWGLNDGCSRAEGELTCRQVSSKRGLEFCHSIGAVPYIETSARENININEALEGTEIHCPILEVSYITSDSDRSTMFIS